MARTDEPFLGRWSRLKQKRRQPEPEPEPGDAPQVEDAEPAPAETHPAAAEEETAAVDLPDIETLDKDSDYSVFMKEGVPEQLKKLALRKLWLSDPDLAVLDGLNDYDDDYRIVPAILGKFASGGDDTPEDPDDAVAGAKAKDEEDGPKAKDEDKDKEEEVAAAKDDEEPGEAGERKEETDADAEAGERASGSANDADGKSG